MIRDIVETDKRFYVGFCNMVTQDKVYFWSTFFPYDIWWRNKYNIPFLSSEHRLITFEAMKFAWLENKMIKDLIDKPVKPVKNKKTDLHNVAYDELQNEIASMTFDEIKELVC